MIESQFGRLESAVNGVEELVKIERENLMDTQFQRLKLHLGNLEEIRRVLVQMVEVNLDNEEVSENLFVLLDYINHGITLHSESVVDGDHILEDYRNALALSQIVVPEDVAAIEADAEFARLLQLEYEAEALEIQAVNNIPPQPEIIRPVNVVPDNLLELKEKELVVNLVDTGDITIESNKLKTVFTSTSLEFKSWETSPLSYIQYAEVVITKKYKSFKEPLVLALWQECDESLLEFSHEMLARLSPVSCALLSHPITLYGSIQGEAIQEGDVAGIGMRNLVARLRQQQLVSAALLVASLFFVVVLFNTSSLIPFSGEQKRHMAPGKGSDSIFKPFTKADLFCLNHDVLLSREYQMKLFRKNFTQREEGLAVFLQSISELLDLPEIASPSFGEATVRYQFITDTHKCGKNFNPRIRNYYTGYRAGTSTLDVKSSTDGHDGPEKVLTDVWEPYPEYSNGLVHKYEWDVHPCKIKYSVEARISVPFEKELHTCNDIAVLFPRVKDNIDESKLGNKLFIHELYTGWWYEFEQRGMLPDGITEYKTAVTLQYPSKEAAIAGIGTPIGTPEWSIRIWSSGHGTGKWVRATIEDINHRYFRILEHFNSPDLPCTEDYDMGNLEM